MSRTGTDMDSFDLSTITSFDIGGVKPVNMIPMMILGQFVFMRQTLPYQTLERSTEYRHASQERVGERPASQFVGLGEDKITLRGTLLPIFTGGRIKLDLLRWMAKTGKAWPLIEGSGRMYGWYVVESISETSEDFMSTGHANKIDFSMSLKRVDEPTPDRMGQQSKLDEMNAIVGKASNRLLGAP